MELSTDRPPAMQDTMPIPFTAICKYAEAFGFYGQQFEDLLDFVRTLDNTFLKYQDEQKQPKKGKQGKKGMVNF